MSDTMSKEEMLEYLRLAYADRGKFAPKMTFFQRCEVLALYRKGITREALAEMYGVDRRTITHIYNPTSVHYKNVRQLEINMGREIFMRTYLNEETLSRAVQHHKEKVESTPKNNKHANGKAGIHVVRGLNCEYDHRVHVRWLEPDTDIQEAGWYYRDMDSDFPDRWFCTSEESLKTSQACYNAMLKDIMDRIA